MAQADGAGGRGGAQVPAIRTMLGWSRFPYFEVAQAAGGDRVTFTDLVRPIGG